jgi:hypothetical protein
MQNDHLLTSKPSRRFGRGVARQATVALLIATALCSASASQAAPVTAPTDHFGFQLGTDGMYASWDQAVAYYQKVATQSDRVQARVLGKSTLGNPFLVLTISSPENLRKASRYQEIARKLADPRGLSEAEIKALAAEGKTVMLVSLAQHSTEIASSQMGPLLVHRLATSNDEQVKSMLDNVILVLIPSFNPDGHVMTKQWVDQTGGTPYQGAGVPDLYHHYAGHDNNRDAYMLNLVESKLWTKIAYDEWHPQIYNDVHQMGSEGARLFLPPKTDPILPDVDPILWREMMLLGASMATRLEAAGIKGVETQVGSYTGWQMPTFHGMTPSRNIVGYHTESASAKMIWPLEQTLADLKPSDRGRPGHFPQVNFPNPWPGGTWRMSDIMRQQEIAVLAAVEAAGRNREMFLTNMALMAQRQVERGRTQAPYGHVVPMAQHDPGTAAKFIALLMEAKVEVHRATESFSLGGTMVQPGDFVIRSDQPLRGYIHSLLVPYVYPDNPLTRLPDGTPLRPKDFASTNLGELMGVTVLPVTQPLTAKLEPLAAAPAFQGTIAGTGSAGWLLTPSWNDSYRAVTQILQAGGQVHRLTAPPAPWAPGTFWIPAAGGTSEEGIRKLAGELGLSFQAAAAAPTGPSYALKPLRVGLYRRFLGGNADEGWTRWIFDNWKFPYSRVDALEVRGGNLNAKYDVLIIPDDRMKTLYGAASGDGAEGDTFPLEYRRTLGDSGVEALKAFADAGGTLVFLAGASDLAIEKFGVPVKNAVNGLSTKQFYSPGSMLKVNFDTSKPLSYGMPAQGLVLFDDAPAFELSGKGAGNVATAASYPASGLLQSGWLDGETYIAKKSALLDVPYGKGRLALIGFGSQTRAEPHGTFKVLFNAMYLTGAPRQ